jgi:acyl-CoA thioester hydrolase
MANNDMIFKSVTPVQVRMTDLDPFGHVNNSIFLSYYDMGRLHYIQQVTDRILNWDELDMVLVHTSCDFKNSVLFNNAVFVGTKVVELGNRSVKMLQHLFTENPYCLKSTCYSVLSGFDKENNCSKPISETLKAKIQAFEK